MEELWYKVRIAALWIMNMIAFFAYRTLAVSDGATEVSILSNKEFASYLLVMMVLAFLSLTLKSRSNRSMNIIAGSIVGVGQLAMFVDGMVGYPTAAFNWMTGATIVIMASIIWFARKWPKRQA